MLANRTEGVDQGQLPDYPVSGQGSVCRWADRGFGKLAQLSAVDEGLQDILLDVEVVVSDRGKPLAQLGQMLDGLFDAVVGHIVGRRFGVKYEPIADVLFDKAITVVAADDRVGELDIFDDSEARPDTAWLPCVRRLWLVGLSDGPVGIQETLAELIQSRATMKIRLSQYST